MKPTRKQLLTSLFSAVVVVTGVAAWNRRPANNANFPDGTHWICKSKECHAEFTLTMKQLGRHHETHYGQPVPCPTCGKAETIRAERCAHCGKISPIRRTPGPCPSCGKMPVTGETG